MSTLIDSPQSDVAPQPPPPRRRDPISSLVAGSVRRRGLVLVAGAVVLAAGAYGLSQGIETTSADESAVGESAVAAELLEGADFGDVPTETVVVSAPDGATIAPEDLAAITADLRGRVAAVDGIGGVADPVVSPDGGTALLNVALAPDAEDDEALAAAAEDLGTAREAVAGEWSGYTLGQVGNASMDAELGAALGEDFQRAEMLALPITLIVLLVAFGAGVAALVPVAVGMASVVTALGLTAAISQFVPVDQNAQSLVLLIGLAVGVDYALFVLRRTREERSGGLSPRDAVRATGSTAVRAVVISGITVVIAMAGLIVAGGMFTSLGIGTAAVVLVSVIASATVLPALLALLGDKVEALRMPWRRRRAEARRAARPVESGVWGRLAVTVTRRPRVWGAAAVLALGGVAAPALGMHTALGGVETLPQDFQTIQAYNRMTEAFPAQGETMQVIVKAGASDADAVNTALVAAGRDAVALGTVRGEPEVSASSDRAVHLLTMAVDGDLSGDRPREELDEVREVIVPGLERSLDEAGVAGARVAVGGSVADVTDFTRWLDSRLPVVIGFVLILTLVVMAVSFGSISLAVATVGLNLLSVGAAYGVLTMVFQGTWAEGLLGFESTGSIAAWLPLMLFVVLFGLSMDYHIFVVSRVREARLAGADARRAVILGVARSAGVVTSAAAVMVGVFAVFGTLSTLEMKQMGVGLAVAVLLDATIVRGVLLPAVLTVLGDRAHRGPRWLPALHG